jgi:hypothetical protein
LVRCNSSQIEPKPYSAEWGFSFLEAQVDVELLPEKVKADAYPVISSMECLLVRCDDPAFIKAHNQRWEHRAPGTYRVVKVEPYEERFIR